MFTEDHVTETSLMLVNNVAFLNITQLKYCSLPKQDGGLPVFV